MIVWKMGMITTNESEYPMVKKNAKGVCGGFKWS